MSAVLGKDCQSLDGHEAYQNKHAYLVGMQSKDESERTERLFAAGKVRDVLPALFRRHDGEEDALREGIRRIVELELGVAAECDHLRREGKDKLLGKANILDGANEPGTSP